jgi:hypothetical protein
VAPYLYRPHHSFVPQESFEDVHHSHVSPESFLVVTSASGAPRGGHPTPHVVWQSFESRGRRSLYGSLGGGRKSTEPFVVHSLLNRISRSADILCGQTTSYPGSSFFQGLANIDRSSPTLHLPRRPGCHPLVLPTGASYGSTYGLEMVTKGFRHGLCFFRRWRI